MTWTSGYAPTESGEIWIERHTEAARIDPALPTLYTVVGPRYWIEPFEADVFSADGAYSHTVRYERPLGVRWISGDTLWAVDRGDWGEYYLDTYVAR